MSLLAPSYDRYMLAKAEFMAKHDELIGLVEMPHRFIGAYFSSLRDQINARYEQLIRPFTRGEREKDLEQEQRISDIYAWLIDEINVNESKCIQSLTSRKKQAPQKTSSAFETDASFYPSPPTTSSENDSAGDLSGASFDISKEIESAKARLLDNQSFVFVESDRNGFGTLFEFKDRYLSVKERLFLESKQAFTNQSNFTSASLSPRDKCHFIKAYWIDSIMRIEECIDLVQYSLTKATMVFRLRSSKSQLTTSLEPSEVEDHELNSQIKSEPSGPNESQMNDDSGETHEPQLDESRSVEETMTATEREVSEVAQPLIRKLKTTERIMPLLQPGMVVWANWLGRLADGFFMWPGRIVSRHGKDSCRILFYDNPKNQTERSIERTIQKAQMKLFFGDNHHAYKREAATSDNFDWCYHVALEDLKKYLNKRSQPPSRSMLSKNRTSYASRSKDEPESEGESQPEAESSFSCMETSQDQEPMTAKESEISTAIQPLIRRSNELRQTSCFLKPGLVVWANWYARTREGNFVWPGRIVKRTGAADGWRVKFYDVPEGQTEKALERVILLCRIRFFFNQDHFDYKREASASGNFEWCYEKALSDLARYLRSIPASESVDQPMESSEVEEDDQSSESEYEPETNVSVSMDTSLPSSGVVNLNTTVHEREVCDAMQPLLRRSAELHLVCRFYKPGLVVWVDWNCGKEAARFMWPARILDKAGEGERCWKVQFFEAPEDQKERKLERVCAQNQMHFFFTQAHVTCKAKAASTGNFEQCYRAALEDLTKYLGERQTKRLRANQEHQVNDEAELGDLSRVDNSADDPTMSVEEWKAFEASQPLLKEVKLLQRLGCFLKPGLVVWANWFPRSTGETFMWPGKIVALAFSHCKYKIKFYDVPDIPTTSGVERTISVSQIRLFFAKGHSSFKREAASSNNFDQCYEAAVADLVTYLETRPISWVLSDSSDAEESDSNSEEKPRMSGLAVAETAEPGSFDEEMMTNNERETYEAAQPFLSRVRASKKNSMSFFRSGLVIWTNWNKTGETPFMWPGKIISKGLGGGRRWRVQFYYVPENQKVRSTDRAINASAIRFFFDSSHFDFKNQASESNNFEWCYQSALRDLQKFLERDAQLF